MKSELDRSLLSWGLKYFPRCKLNGLLDTSYVEGSSHLLESFEEALVTQGKLVEVGIEITPSEEDLNHMPLDNFKSQWEKFSELIGMSFKIYRSGEILLTTEISSLHLSTPDYLQVKKNGIATKFVKTMRGVRFSAVTAFKVGETFENEPLTLMISLVIQSELNKLACEWYPVSQSEDKLIRNLVDLGRNKPPRLTSLETSIPIRMINPLRIHSFAYPLGLWSSLLSVTISNNHPSTPIVIENIDILLHNTVTESIPTKTNYTNFEDGDKCKNIAAESWLTLQWIGLTNNIVINSGESYNFAAKVLPRCSAADTYEVMDLLATSSNVVSTIPTKCDLTHLRTPVSVRWKQLCNTHAISPVMVDKHTPAAVDNDVEIHSDSNPSYRANSSIQWSLKPSNLQAPQSTGHHAMHPEELVVTVSGPSQCIVLQPITITVTVCNTTDSVRSLSLYLSHSSSATQQTSLYGNPSHLPTDQREAAILRNRYLITAIYRMEGYTNFACY